MPSAPSHPGIVLDQQFMRPHGLSQYRVAVDIGVPPRRINQIVHGQRGITADTALRLGRYFGNDPAWWMALQARWELELGREQLGPRLITEVTVFDPEAPRRGRGRPRRSRRQTGASGRAPADRRERRPQREDRGHLFFD